MNGRSAGGGRGTTTDGGILADEGRWPEDPGGRRGPSARVLFASYTAGMVRGTCMLRATRAEMPLWLLSSCPRRHSASGFASEGLLRSGSYGAKALSCSRRNSVGGSVRWLCT